MKERMEKMQGEVQNLLSLVREEVDARRPGVDRSLALVPVRKK